MVHEYQKHAFSVFFALPIGTRSTLFFNYLHQKSLVDATVHINPIHILIELVLIQLFTRTNDVLSSKLTLKFRICRFHLDSNYLPLVTYSFVVDLSFSSVWFFIWFLFGWILNYYYYFFFIFTICENIPYLRSACWIFFLTTCGTNWGTLNSTLHFIRYSFGGFNFD